jgi:hypothetical protein
MYAFYRNHSLSPLKLVYNDNYLTNEPNIAIRASHFVIRAKRFTGFIVCSGYLNKCGAIPFGLAVEPRALELRCFINKNDRGTRFAVTAAGELTAMNKIQIFKTMKGFGVAFAMVVGLMVFSGASANAQDGRYDDRSNQNRHDYRYDNDQDDRYNNGQDDRYNGRDRNGNQSYRFAYQKGYHAGVKQGMRDARKHRRGNNRDNDGYYGNNQGYGNNTGILGTIFGGGTNRNSGRNQQAYQRGYQRGYQEGLNRGRYNRHRNNNDPYYNGY